MTARQNAQAVPHDVPAGQVRSRRLEARIEGQTARERERNSVIRCASCGAEYRIETEKFLPGLRAAGWRYREAGKRPFNLSIVSVCADCAGPKDW